MPSILNGFEYAKSRALVTAIQHSCLGSHFAHQFLYTYFLPEHLKLNSICVNQDSINSEMNEVAKCPSPKLSATCMLLLPCLRAALAKRTEKKRSGLARC